MTAKFNHVSCFCVEHICEQDKDTDCFYENVPDYVP